MKFGDRGFSDFGLSYVLKLLSSDVLRQPTQWGCRWFLSEIARTPCKSLISLELIYVSSIIPIHLVNASEAEGSREVACQQCSPSLGWPRPCLPSFTSSRNLERLIAHLFTHRCNLDKPYMLNDQLRKSDPTSYFAKHTNQEVQSEVTF